jgi:hypothetical protein
MTCDHSLLLFLLSFLLLHSPWHAQAIIICVELVCSILPEQQLGLLLLDHVQYRMAHSYT